MTLRKRRITNLLLLALPAVLFFHLSIAAAVWWWYQGLPPAHTIEAHILLFSIMHVGWLVILYLFQLLDLRTYRGWQWVYRLVWAMGLATLFGTFVFYLQPDLLVTPRRMLAVHVAGTTGLLLFWGATATWAMARRRPLHILMMGIDSMAHEQFSLLAKRQGFRFRCTHVPATHPAPHDEFAARKPDIICLPDTIPSGYQQLMQDARARRIPVYPYSTLYENMLRRIPVDEINTVSQPSNNAFMQLHLAVKRLVDLAVGLILGMVLIATAPVVVPLIKLSGPGPIFFLQRRITLDGKSFTIYKYRTMRTDTDSSKWTQKDDPRITKVGSFLRRSHIDELPQAINLIKGDLSLVGPRPEQEVIVEELNNLIPFYAHRHRIRSGLTGWAQLQGYAGTVKGTQDKLEYDLYYLKHQSLLFDLEIILKTIRNLAGFSGR